MIASALKSPEVTYGLLHFELTRATLLANERLIEYSQSLPKAKALRRSGCITFRSSG